MLKLILITLSASTIIFTTPGFALAQSTSDEEARGKMLFDKLQLQKTSCSDFTEENYENIGEYYMGIMAGSSHEDMNKRMEQMMGKDQAEQIYITIGKRLSGCDTNAQYPGQTSSFMNMMGGGGFPMMGLGWNMMGGYGPYSWVFSIVVLILIILAIVVLFRYLGRSQSTGPDDAKNTPLEILNSRYAKGEIDKAEYLDKKNDLKR